MSNSSSITVRLHISGISPTNCSSADLHSRFSTFGQVVSVHHWPPPVNAVGQPQNFAYVTLTSTPQQLKRCMSLLSGTVWKGGKIRVGEARKDYRGGYGEEQDGLVQPINVRPKAKTDVDADGEAADGKRKKRRRIRADGVEDHKTFKSGVITEEDVKEGKVWGWRVTAAGHLLRPLQMRPAHPLPPVKVALTSASKGKEDESKNKKSRKSKAQQAKVAKDKTRARLQIIDPSRYGAVHLTQAMLDDGEDSQSSGEVWVCEEDEGDGNGKVRWVRRGGDEVEAEEVQLGGVHKPTAVAESSSDSSSSSEEESSSSSSDDSDSEESISSASSSLAERSTLQASPVEARQSGPAAPSQHFEPVAEGSFALQPYDPNEDDAFSEGYNEDAVLANAEKKAAQISTDEEKQRHANLLREMFGDSFKAADQILDGSRADEEESDDEGHWWESLKKGKQQQEPVRPTKQLEPVVEPQATQPAEPEEETEILPPAEVAETPAEAPAHVQPVSRRAALLAQMRAGKTQEEEAAASSRGFQPVARFEPSAASQDVEMEHAPESTSTDEPAAVWVHQSTSANGIMPPPAAPGFDVKMGSLKDMFKPQESSGLSISLFGGFGLGSEELDGDFDFQADEVEDEAADEHQMANKGMVDGVPSRWPQPDQPAKVVEEERRTGPLPFFFPHTTISSHPLHPLQALRSSSSYIPFSRNGITNEEINSKWEQRKLDLTQDYKRRHREGVKKKRRKVTGARGVQGGVVR